MTTVIRATGEDDASATTVALTGGRGGQETGVPQVHIALRAQDGDRIRLLQGWFPLGEVLDALEAVDTPPSRTILSEPAL